MSEHKLFLGKRKYGSFGNGVLWYLVVSQNSVLVGLWSDIAFCQGCDCMVFYSVVICDSLVYFEIVGIVWCVV